MLEKFRMTSGLPSRSLQSEPSELIFHEDCFLKDFFDFQYFLVNDKQYIAFVLFFYNINGEI